MRRKCFIPLAAVLAVLFLFIPGRAERDGRGGEDGGHFDRARSRGEERAGSARWESGGGREIIRSQRVNLARPDRPQDLSRVIRDNRQIAAPGKYETGETIRQPAASAPPRQHTEVTGNRGVMREISGRRSAETVRGRYYWHNSGGMRYAHYFDDRGVHWYGFYHGPSFYWTRYYGGNWWWFDPSYSRWVFWWDGYWWWNGPGGAYFVYMDNNYYPYEDGAVTVQKSETVPPPGVKPAPDGGKGWDSPDGGRMVRVMGDQSEAFLYDKTGSAPDFLAYLGRGVEKVRFSGGTPGEPLQILLDFKDGSFAVFDMDGKALKPGVHAPPPAGAPPSDEAAPPPPASAPGK